MGASYLVLLFLLLSSCKGEPIGPWHDGRATYYLEIDGGNCGYGPISRDAFPHGFIVAPNQALFAESEVCGACFEVVCDADRSPDACLDGNSSVIVQATDQCPCEGNEGWCCGDMDHFDLSLAAFEEIAKTSAGVFFTKYRRVACDVRGPLKLKLKDGTNAWWFSVLPFNVGGGGTVSKVEVKDSGASGWISMERQSYNYWLAESGPGFQAPLEVRVTNEVSGESLIVMVNAIQEESIHEADTNFDATDGVDGGSAAPCPSSSLLSSYPFLLP
ncbi:Expansin-like EG45 domain-containing protein [Balamuthia mandrillaris]